MKIAVDAMGGDFAPLEIVLGSIAAVHEYDTMDIVLVGDESKIKEDIKKIRNLFEIISNNGKKIGDF